MFYKYIKVIKEIFDIHFLLIILFVSIFIFLVDVPNLKKNNYIKEAKIAKTIGIIYIIVGFLAYILFKIF